MNTTGGLKDVTETSTFEAFRHKQDFHDIFEDAVKLIDTNDFKTRALGVRLAIFESRHKKPDKLSKYIRKIEFAEGKEALLMILNKYEGSIALTILQELLEVLKQPILSRPSSPQKFPSFLFVLNNLDLGNITSLSNIEVINEILTSTNAPRTIIFLIKNEQLQNDEVNQELVNKFKEILPVSAYVTTRTDEALKQLYAGDTAPLKEEA